MSHTTAQLASDADISRRWPLVDPAHDFRIITLWRGEVAGARSFATWPEAREDYRQRLDEYDAAGIAVTIRAEARRPLGGWRSILTITTAAAPAPLAGVADA